MKVVLRLRCTNARFIGQTSCGFVHGRTYSIYSRIKKRYDMDLRQEIECLLPL